MRTRWKTIARVVKTHAKSGEVVVASVHGLPSLLSKGMTVALVPPALKSDRYLEVRSASSPEGSSQLVSFAGIDSIGDAQELVGKTVLARMDDLPEDIELLDRESLIGKRVIDASRGELGRVAEVMAGPTQDVFVLEGAAGQLLVPVLPEFVESIDVDTIRLSLPGGAVLEGEL